MAQPTPLIVQPLPEKLAALRREHDKLLGKIRNRKGSLEKLVGELREAGSHAATTLEPLYEEARALHAQVHALFKELCAPGRLPARARAKVARLYADLIDDGALMLDDEMADPLDGGDEEEEEAPSARRPAAAPSIRDVYRRLADAIHPDKVQDEREKAWRTEAMKDVTVAYGRGDLARLLELERSVMADGSRAARLDDLEEQLAALQRTIGELRRQLASLDRELRELRRTPMAELAIARRHGEDPLGELAEDARSDIQQLRTIRDHVLAFHSGKIPLAVFLRGPAPPDAEFEAHFAAAVEQALAELSPGTRPRGRGKRKREPISGDLPF